MALAPFREGFGGLRREVEHLFDDMMGDFFGRRRTGIAALHVPPMEAYARDGDLVMHADLPGCALEDVNITLEGTTLTLSGMRKGAPEGDGIVHYLDELPYGDFSRAVTVPEGADADSIKARLEHGVLELVVPGVVAETRPKQIAIEAA